MNCLDCVDRSNSVQSFVAQEVSLSEDLPWDPCSTYIGCFMGKTGKTVSLSYAGQSCRSMVQNGAGRNTEDKKQKHI